MEARVNLHNQSYEQKGVVSFLIYFSEVCYELFDCKRIIHR